MAALAAATRHVPLTGGQRVLALTFMVGAKHQLSESVRRVPGLVGRIECSTIDSFAWRLVRRWRGLLEALGVNPIAEEDYDGQCAAAATLLERPEVGSWVAASFPIVLVDEAQDLKPERLSMVAALSAVTELLIAADEFQCLDPALRPNPMVTWLHGICRPRVLDVVHRTRVQGLLDAATAIRAGNPPSSQGGFRIIASRGPNMAPSLVSNAIGWGRPVGGTLAIITPSRAGNFASTVVTRVGERANIRGSVPTRSAGSARTGRSSTLSWAASRSRGRAAWSRPSRPLTPSHLRRPPVLRSSGYGCRPAHGGRRSSRAPRLPRLSPGSSRRDGNGTPGLEPAWRR